MAKRQIPKAVFEPWDGFTAEDLLDTPALVHLVKKETPLAIKDAFANKKTFATLFQINHSENYIDIPKSYWIPALEECIKYLIEEQRYEECGNLKELIDSIKKGTKRTVKKSENGTTNGQAANRDSNSNK